ncbi:MAG TPA: aspartate kinase, partial [Vicinamibacterales bacterium]|nr:aspartate kinase [Vicinamibacterales bacterium]
MLDVVLGSRAQRWPRRAAAARLSEPVPRGTIRVLKFGGSSLAAADRIRDVAAIVLDAAAHAPIVVVVSAFHGVTNQLIECARRAAQREPHEELYDAIAARHRSCIDALLGGDGSAIRQLVDDHLRELHGTLTAIVGRGNCPAELIDETASFGERLSALIVSGYLNQFRAARFVDARGLVTTDDRFTHANVLFDHTNRAVRDEIGRLWRRSPDALPVVTGFIGRTEDGRTTTIGRNGSDYTAAIVGAALDAAAIEIWTDVDGVMSADPKVVPSASVLPQMTYDDARELSYFGAKVVHPQAIEPAVERSI